MDKKIEVARIVVKSNVFVNKKDKILSNKINKLNYDTIKNFRELDTLFNCKHYYDIEFFYDIESKCNPFQINKLETDFVTREKIRHFFYERYNIKSHMFITRGLRCKSVASKSPPSFSRRGVRGEAVRLRT